MREEEGKGEQNEGRGSLKVEEEEKKMRGGG